MKPSEHFGTVGERGTFTLSLIQRKSFINEEYTRHFQKLQDEWGNVCITWTSTPLHYADSPEKKGDELKSGEVIKVEALVKEHGHYNGECQTILSYVREVQTKEQQSALRAYRKEQKRQELIAAGICPECKGKGSKRGKVCEACQGGW